MTGCWVACSAMVDEGKGRKMLITPVTGRSASVRQEERERIYIPQLVLRRGPGMVYR